MCVVLRPHMDISNEVICILISSYINFSHGKPAERIVWVRPPTEIFDVCKELDNATVSGLSEWVSGERRSPYEDVDMKVRNMGMLNNGARFLVYRVALYTDSFKQLK